MCVVSASVASATEGVAPKIPAKLSGVSTIADDGKKRRTISPPTKNRKTSCMSPLNRAAQYITRE